MAGPNRNGATVIASLAAVGMMIGVVAASVPLYRLFCQVTGYGGTTAVAVAAPEVVSDRVMTVRFDSNVNGNLPWRFAPAQDAVEVRLGEEKLIFFVAENTSDRPVTGTATFNVAPAKAGQYFAKIECFCFTEQTLAPGQRIEMPVSFYVDPRIADDRNTDEVETITLSYTFFEARKTGAAEQARADDEQEEAS